MVFVEARFVFCGGRTDRRMEIRTDTLCEYNGLVGQLQLFITNIKYKWDLYLKCVVKNMFRFYE